MVIAVVQVYKTGPYSDRKRENSRAGAVITKYDKLPDN